MINEDVLVEIEHLSKRISPLPYFLYPEIVDFNNYPISDAYIAFGDPNDGNYSWDLLEHYEVETDYKYIIAACNTAISLVAEIRGLSKRVAELEQYIADKDHNEAMDEMWHARYHSDE